ncbi:MAG: hypothetical protein EBU66_11590 [Bacteroidetes bacterium]|jgi:hypothetical protein|nr:hypothetical protein [Bacteroidota bacterium]
MAELSSSVAIFFFLAVFGAYSYYKHTKKGVLGGGIVFLFFIVLIIGEYFINLAMSKDICGFDQEKTALIATLLPWFVVLGALKAALVVFPGWLTPFSNTFGYIFVSVVTDMKDVFNSILTPQFDLAPESQKGPGASGSTQSGGAGDNTGSLQDAADIPADEIKNKRDIGRALEQIYTDQSILLNELNLDNLDRFWDSFKESRLIRKSAKIEELEKIRTFLIMKSIVGEFIWLVLCGLLVVSISYNYILNMGCSFTPEQQKIRAQVLKEKQEDAKKKADAEKNKVMTITS